MATPAKRRRFSHKGGETVKQIKPKEEPIDFHKIVQQGNLEQLCNILQNSSSRTGINRYAMPFPTVRKK